MTVFETYAELPMMQAFFWVKTVLFAAHLTIFFLYHEKYRTYYRHVKKCPTNDCVARAARKAAKKENQLEFEDPEGSDLFGI